MELAGALRGLRVEGDEQLPGIANYFIGNDPAKWHSNVPTYAKVKYSGVYPGVDLVYYGNQRQLEYDFVVAAGGDPGPIQMHVAGAAKLALNRSGDLELFVGRDRLLLHRPILYQGTGSARRMVKGGFELRSGHIVSFRVGQYDHSKELVIDPTLVYSTYLGGSGVASLKFGQAGDVAYSVAADAAGNAYVTGSTQSADFPVTSGAFQKTFHSASKTVFVTKINASGSALLYSTYLGGTLFESASGVTVDASGNAYITGSTASSDFPTTQGAFQTAYCPSACAQVPAFITKLNSTGSALLYSTFLGPAAPVGIVVDSAGAAYIAGTTTATNYPVTPGAFQTVNNNKQAGVGVTSNAIITKLNASGSALVYSTYLGGSGASSGNQGQGDSAGGIALDSAGAVYVTGYTFSPDFPTTSGAFQLVNGGLDQQASNAFVTKLNTSGSALVYSTYLGGFGFDYNSPGYFLSDVGAAIAVDGSGNAYVTGSALSSNFPVTKGAFMPTLPPKSPGVVFVTKLSTDAKTLVYSTFVAGTIRKAGSNLTDQGNAIAVDQAGDAILTGLTLYSNFPTTGDAFQQVNKAAQFGQSSAFLLELNPTGSAPVYSTYLGGSGTLDDASFGGSISRGLALTSANTVYIAGSTYDADFPVTSGSFQQVNHAAAVLESNAFLANFSFQSATVTTLTTDETPQNLGETTTFTAAVKLASGSGIPGGTVNFVVDNVPMKTVTLAYGGHAIYYNNSLTIGTHHIVANFSGPGYTGSSASLTQTVSGKVASPTFFPLGGTYRAAQQVALTTASAGSSIYYTTDGTNPTVASAKYAGPITISANGTIKAIAADNVATVSPIAAASYKLVPTAIGGTTTLTSSANPSKLGQPVTFTSTVIPTSGPIPSGSISFRNGDEIMSVVPLVNGVASYSTYGLTLLGHNITAVYTGDATHAEKGSPVLVQLVNP